MNQSFKPTIHMVVVEICLAMLIVFPFMLMYTEPATEAMWKHMPKPWSNHPGVYKTGLALTMVGIWFILSWWIVRTVHIFEWHRQRPAA